MDSAGVDGPSARATISRALSVLDLFTADTPLWTVGRMCEVLGITPPTCYRYVRELVGAGLLMRLSGASYGLGPRIVLLDYTMRQADPLLREAAPVMQALAQRTECDCVMSALYGNQILDIHRESGRLAGQEPVQLAYGRGRPRPLFQGATPKVIIAAQTARWQRQLYDAHAMDAAAAGMGAAWPDFRATLTAIARQAHYVSRGELEPHLSAIAVSIPAIVDEPSTFALAVVTRSDRFEMFNVPLLVRRLADAAREIADAVARHAMPAADRSAPMVPAPAHA